MLRLAVRVPREDAEIVLAELLTIVPSGVEEVDLGEQIEYAIYGAPGEVPTLPDLEAVIRGVKVEVSTTEIEDGWEDRWREFHKPLVVTGRLRVRPPWEPAGTEEHDLVVDPGRAFGTGAHPTTSLCLEILLDVEGRGSLHDLGCGSGVIAILAARMGFGPVTAADYDQLAVDATAANAIVNAVDLSVMKSDLRTDGLPDSDVLVANILSSVLINLAGLMGGWHPRAAILSGILDEQADEVLGAWAELGYSEVERRSREGWSALLLHG
jgi:ribosomal protein L11 methyltransferase